MITRRCDNELTYYIYEFYQTERYQKACIVSEEMSGSLILKRNLFDIPQKDQRRTQQDESISHAHPRHNIARKCWHLNPTIAKGSDTESIGKI